MHRLAFAALAFILASPASAIEDTDQDRCRYSILHKQTTDQGIAACNRAIASKRFRGEELAELHLDRAQLLMGKANFTETALYNRALPDLEEVLRIGRSLGNPSHEILRDGYYYRAQVYIFKKDFRRAIADLTEVVRIRPNDFNAWYSRGESYFGQRDYDRAIADYNETIRLDPSYQLAYRFRALAHEKKGELDKALVDIRKAFELDVARGHSGVSEKEIIDRIEPKIAAAATPKSASRTSPAVTPIPAASAPAPSAATPNAAKIDPGDSEVCAYDGKDKDAIVEACSRLIAARTLRGQALIRAYDVRGFRYYLKGDYDLAIADFTEVIRLDPNDRGAYYYRANSHHLKNDSARALADFGEALRIEPNNGSTYYARAHAHLRAGDYDRAIDDFSQSIRLSPKFAPTFVNRGEIYEKKGELDKALADFRMALSLDSNLAEATAAIARINARAPGSSVVEKPAVTVPPAVTTPSAAKSDVGDSELCAYEGKDKDATVAACSRLIASGTVHGQNLVSLYNIRAFAYQYKDDFDPAIADFTEVIRLDPNNGDAYYFRGMTYLTKNDYARATSDFFKAIIIKPHAAAYHFRGVSYLRAGDHDRAIEDFNMAIELSPKSGLPFANRGEAYKKKGDLDKARADFRTALSLASEAGDPQKYHERGYTYLKMGDYDRAIADFTESIRLSPKSARTFELRGEAYENKGDLDNALADFNMALTLSPNRPNATTAIARMNARAPSVVQRPAVTEPAAPQVSSVAPQPATPAPPVFSVPQQPTPAAAAPVIDIGRRVALVIGNSAYKNVSVLPNPHRDAEAVAATLRRVGFQVVTHEGDLTREKLVAALRTFAREADRADWALVYFAGHGIEMNGINYLIPVDAKIEVDRDVEFEAVPLNQVMNAVDGAKQLRLVLLDACRDNPFARQMRRTIASRSIGRGLARVEPDAGTLVVYAAKDGEVALDGDGTNSPFAAALVQNLIKPGLEIRRLFDYVRDDVIEATGRRQQPFSYGSVPGRHDFYFVQK